MWGDNIQRETFHKGISQPLYWSCPKRRVSPPVRNQSLHAQRTSLHSDPSHKANVVIEFVDISLWVVLLTVQQHVKLSSVIQLLWERTAWRNTQMLLALESCEAEIGQAEIITPAHHRCKRRTSRGRKTLLSHVRLECFQFHAFKKV